MHRIAATPGGWTPDSDGVIYIQQTPAPIVFITAADTDIQTLSAASQQLPPEFPEMRVVNLLQLQQQLTLDTYAEEVLSQAKLILLRLLGGRAYWSYGLEVLRETVEMTGGHLIVMPGDDGIDPDLCSHSTVPLTIVNRLWQYFNEGGVANFCNGLKYAQDKCLDGDNYPPDPQSIPRVKLYPVAEVQGAIARVGILFYRAHYLASNTKPIDALCQGLIQQNLQPVPLYISSLRDRSVQDQVIEVFSQVDLILNTTGFSLAKLDRDQPNLDLWQTLNRPVFQVILSGGGQAQWQNELRGLLPRDVAMNVALPEVDGRIITRAVSFKQMSETDDRLETEVVRYEPVGDRIDFVVQLANHWASLIKTPVHQQRIALILPNYPNKDARLANGVGLDTPASTVEILKRLKAVGVLRWGGPPKPPRT